MATLTSIYPTMAPMTGGTEITLVGTWPIDSVVTVHMGPLGTVDDPPCYGGQGLGYTALSLDGLTLVVASPPLPVGLSTVTAISGVDFLQLIDALTVVERTWPIRLHGIRKSFPTWHAVGSRSLDHEDLD